MRLFFVILGAISTLIGACESSAWCNENQSKWLKIQMERALGSFAQAIDTAYAPTEWKRQLWGWDLEEQLAIAAQRIAQEPLPTIQEFRNLLRRLFASAKDHHLAVFFYSTERSDLPFQIRKASDGYYISGIDRSYLPRRTFPIALGDELLSFNQEPIATALYNLRQELGLLPDLTGERLAENFLTARQGALGHPILNGTASVSIRRQTDGKVLSFRIPWLSTPEKVTFPNFKSASIASKHNNSALQEFISDKSETLESARNIWEIGGRYTYTPDLGKVLWRTDGSWGFHAYLFEVESGQRYGYLRIPNFSFSSMHLAQLEDLIAYFEGETQGLVIDIANNPGGYLLTAYAILTMLTEKPIIPPLHSIKLYPKEINRAAKGLEELSEANTLEEIHNIMGKTNEGYPVTVEFAEQLKKYFAFLLAQWSQGKLLTDPCAYLGIDAIVPHPRVHYKKPILLLINSLCFSGSDFFAAILQDSKRATLMGETTAGAGGVMLEVSYPNLFGVQSFHLTTTLAERNNKQYIENVGVTPEISYSLTQEDLTRHHASYVAEIIKQIKSLSP